jgi:nickel-dependent lactate racemase
MYQAVKGLSAAARIVKPGGAIIVAADCCEGAPPNSDYEKLLRKAESPSTLLQQARSGHAVAPGMWQAFIHALFCMKSTVFFYSKNLTRRQISDAFMIPCDDIEKAVSRLLQKYGSHAAICVMPDGPMMVPCRLPRQGSG